jgi:hypothetical protein
LHFSARLKPEGFCDINRNIYKRIGLLKIMKSKKEVDGKKTSTNHNGLGIVAVVLGILSIVNLGVSGLILGIVGLVFGARQKKIERNNWSKWGIILGVIGVIGSLVAIYYVVNYLAPQLNSLQQGYPLPINGQ